MSTVDRGSPGLLCGRKGCMDEIGDRTVAPRSREDFDAHDSVEAFGHEYVVEPVSGEYALTRKQSTMHGILV
jgi:hypothetical protein